MTRRRRPAPPKRKRGRPRKHEMLTATQAGLTRIEQQRTQSLLRRDARRGCQPNAMSVSNATARGFRETWIGYKLHLDTANGIVLVAAILTAASHP